VKLNNKFKAAYELTEETISLLSMEQAYRTKDIILYKHNVVSDKKIISNTNLLKDTIRNSWWCSNNIIVVCDNSGFQDLDAFKKYITSLRERNTKTQKWNFNKEQLLPHARHMRETYTQAFLSIHPVTVAVKMSNSKIAYGTAVLSSVGRDRIFNFIHNTGGLSYCGANLNQIIAWIPLSVLFFKPDIKIAYANAGSFI
jgi:hypothetical protein